MKIIPSCRPRVKGRKRFLDATAMLAGIGASIKPAGARVEVNLIGERRMAALNRIYRGRRGAAEILTFPYGAGCGRTAGEDPIGEIFLCWRKLAAGSRRRRVSTETYLARLLVHGLCHILGYRHSDPESEAEMEGVEKKLLGRCLSAADVEKLFA